MRCTYCQREYAGGFYNTNDPNHHPDCPDFVGLTKDEAKKRRDAFWIGHTDAFKLDGLLERADPLDKENPQYVMGFGEGIVSIEERENGYNPFAEGNDPGPWG